MPARVEYWSSRDFAEVLGYGDYRNFEGVIEKAICLVLTVGVAKIIPVTSPK